METSSQNNTKIKELILINKDRYEIYNIAAKETKDIELKTVFKNYSRQGEQFAKELWDILPDQNYLAPNDETKYTGKLYSTFMTVKTTSKDYYNRKAILSSCESGENEAKRTYEEVLKNHDGIEFNALDIIKKQKIELQDAHDKIKALRDMA